MQRRRLGQFDVSMLGLGTARLASLGSRTSRADAGRLLDTAADSGINLIDTADTYGSTDCERLLGELLKHRKSRFVVMTKGGLLHADLPGPMRALNQFAKKARRLNGRRQNFRPDYINGAIEASLRRLQLDAIDIYLLHSVTAEASRDDELAGILREAVAAGKIRSFGFSVDDSALYSAAASTQGCSIVQAMVNPVTARAHREHCPQLRLANIGVIANQVLASGLDSSHAPLARVDMVAAERGIARSAVLLRFAAAQPAVASVLIGTNDPFHLAANARAFDTDVAPEDGDW
ncbi:MAG TPA: aldo/keto reductase [Acidimicrobiales bacterium]|nr:aldo/keto reductase [Acidimicrobiales bacterium]